MIKDDVSMVLDDYDAACAEVNTSEGQKKYEKMYTLPDGRQITGTISFNCISFHFVSFHFISFHFISFHFISFHFICVELHCM